LYLPVGLTLGNSLAFVVALLAAGERDLQNTADAAALAGVAELPNDPAAAKTRAIEWAANNGVASGEIKTIEVRPPVSRMTPCS